MSKVPSRQARLAHAAKHADLWNAGKKGRVGGVVAHDLPR
jgi:hypothetical protein